MIDPNAGQASGSGSTVSDGGGIYPIVTFTASAAFSANGQTVAPAVAGFKTKVLAFNIYCTLWTSDGTISIKDGTGGTSIFLVGRVITPGVGQRFTFDMGGKVIATGSVNTLVELNYAPGAASLQYSVIYYQAP